MVGTILPCVKKTRRMNKENNFVNPNYNEGAPQTSGNIANSYTVEEKDTLPEIARKFGISVDELLEANKDTIGDGNHLVHSGTKLMIPIKKT